MRTLVVVQRASTVSARCALQCFRCTCGDRTPWDRLLECEFRLIPRTDYGPRLLRLVISYATLTARGASHAGGVTRPGADGVTRGRSRNSATRSPRRWPEAARNPSGDGHLRSSALSFVGGDRPGSPSSSLRAERPQKPARAFSFVPRDFYHGLLLHDRRK